MGKTYDSLLQNYGDKPGNPIIGSKIFKFKTKLTESTLNNLKNQSTNKNIRNTRSFQKTLETHLINCEIILILIWSIN